MSVEKVQDQSHTKEVSKERKQELRAALKLGEGLYTNKFPQATLDAISEIMKTSDMELRNEATYLVHMGLRQMEDKIIHHFRVTKADMDYEDYISEMFIAIMQNLPRWKSKKAMLSTFFEPILRNACLMYPVKSGLYKTHYAAVVAMDVEKARKELEKEDNPNPSVIEIREYLSVKMNRKHSETTIINSIEQKKTLVSFDDTNNTITASVIVDPLKDLIEKEKKAEVHLSVEELEPQYRLLIEAEIKIYETGDYDKKAIPDAVIAKELKKTIPNATGAWVNSIRQAAEQSFRRIIEKKRRREKEPINLFKPDFEYIRQSQEDVEEAALIDFNALFA